MMLAHAAASWTSREIEAVARLSPALTSRPSSAAARSSSAEQNFAWADPDFFKVLPLPASWRATWRRRWMRRTAWCSRAALARKYFGRDAPVGEILLVDGRPMRVTAVIAGPAVQHRHRRRDLRLVAGAAEPDVASTRRSTTPRNNTLATYFRLRPGASRGHHASPGCPPSSSGAYPLPRTAEATIRAQPPAPGAPRRDPPAPADAGDLQPKPPVDPAVIAGDRRGRRPDRAWSRRSTSSP